MLGRLINLGRKKKTIVWQALLLANQITRSKVNPIFQVRFLLQS